MGFKPEFKPYHKPASLAAHPWRQLALATLPSLSQITSSPDGLCLLQGVAREMAGAE